jgi:hypothetical protein
LSELFINVKKYLQLGGITMRRENETRGRKKKPTVMYTMDKTVELYFPGVMEAARYIKEHFTTADGTIETIAGNISLSKQIERRSVYGFKFRDATPKEVAEYNKEQGNK